MSPGPGPEPLQPQQGGESNGESEHVVMIDQLLVIDGLPVDVKTFSSSQVFLTVPGLPLLDEAESYSCVFEDIPSHAVVSGGRVSCQSPSPGSLPMVPLGQGEQLLDSSSVPHRDLSFSPDVSRGGLEF